MSWRTTLFFQSRSFTVSTLGSPNAMPCAPISCASSMTRAACSSAFDGMQPTFKQTPPSVGQRSTSVTSAPSRRRETRPCSRPARRRSRRVAVRGAAAGLVARRPTAARSRRRRRRRRGRALGAPGRGPAQRFLADASGAACARGRDCAGFASPQRTARRRSVKIRSPAETFDATLHGRPTRRCRPAARARPSRPCPSRV